jgi:nitrogen fixation protein FixH
MMKMNWGTKLIAGMVIFMLFIISMVVYMFRVHGNDALVEEDYYEKGINYNQEYNAKRNVLTDNAQPEVVINKHQIIISLKDSASYELKMLRPATKKDDIELNGTTVNNANLILIDREKMPTGLWLLDLKWTSNGKEYQFTKNITL